jgi:hypothetical protein
MAEWRFDGQRRTKRKYTTYQNSPLPTAEDRLLFVLLYLKGNPLQAHHGVMFGMMQGKANRWLNLLMPLFQKTLRTLGVAPSRTLEELAQRGDIVERQEAAQTPEADAPLPCHDATEDGLGAPVRRNRRLATVAEKMHTLKNLLLINRPMMILLLSDTCADIHDKRLADAYLLRPPCAVPPQFTATAILLVTDPPNRVCRWQTPMCIAGRPACAVSRLCSCFLYCANAVPEALGPRLP